MRKKRRKKTSWMSWRRLGMSKYRGGMGFRGLEVFNLALLAKQGWRLIQHLESLVIIAFSWHSILLGRNPSYAWHSIFQAREILERGLVWRVGNGSMSSYGVIGGYQIPLFTKFNPG
jgi:hypothetical protein